MNGTGIIDNLILHGNNGVIDELISYARSPGLSPPEILYLAKGLAKSGTVIENSEFKNLSDIPSTGGPASLSTLICPLFLKIFGNQVLKLGVPGRPAGGIDVLSLIDGYNVNPGLEEVSVWIKESGYVHFLANSEFAPLDKLVFNYRKANNALNIPALVVASILAKKIAVGVKYVGLDIRVSEFGNFGRTWQEARENAQLFIEVAKLAGIEAKCFITPGAEPQQPYIGRGEALLALKKIFSGDMNHSLRKHLGHCFSMASSVSGNKNKEALSLTLLYDAFAENVRIQNGSMESFNDIAEKIQQAHIYRIISPESGFLIIKLENIREAIVNIQQIAGAEIFADPCGIILMAMTNDYLSEGDIICTFRCSDTEKEQFEYDLTRSFEIRPRLIKTYDFEEII
jgi:thymidine phosphorylase